MPFIALCFLSTLELAKSEGCIRRHFSRRYSAGRVPGGSHRQPLQTFHLRWAASLSLPRVLITSCDMAPTTLTISRVVGAPRRLVTRVDLVFLFAYVAISRCVWSWRSINEIQRHPSNLAWQPQTVFRAPHRSDSWGDSAQS